MNGKHLSGNAGLNLQGYAWLCSLMLHVIVLGASLLSMQYLTREPFQEPFHLDVTLVRISDVNIDRNLVPSDDQNASLLENQTGLTQPTQERERVTEMDVATLGRTIRASPVQGAPQQAPKTPVSEEISLRVLNQEVPTATQSHVPSKSQQPEKHARIRAPPRPSIEELSAPTNASDEASSSVIDREVPGTPPLPISAEAIRVSPNSKRANERRRSGT